MIEPIETVIPQDEQDFWNKMNTPPGGENPPAAVDERGISDAKAAEIMREADDLFIRYGLAPLEQIMRKDGWLR